MQGLYCSCFELLLACIYLCFIKSKLEYALLFLYGILKDHNQSNEHSTNKNDVGGGAGVGDIGRELGEGTAIC